MSKNQDTLLKTFQKGLKNVVLAFFSKAVCGAETVLNTGKELFIISWNELNKK